MELQTRTSSQLLNDVSRSFALCIPLLEKNKAAEVENMYLLSRVVDTIEDSFLPTDRKKALMEMFFDTLNYENIPEFVCELGKGTIDDHDKILSNEGNFRMIIETFRLLDEKVRNLSVELLKEMSSGMVKYLEKDIGDFKELDEYCYFVAGTVGLYMNRLVELKDKVTLDSAKAVSLGRYLQKVNVIKNFRKDLSEGRIFWPSSLFQGLDRSAACLAENREQAMGILAKMIDSAKSESAAAYDYIASVPCRLEGYRKFLLLSAFMAAESIKLMKDNQEIFANPTGVKIPRARMPEIICMSIEASQSNELLWKFKKELEE